MKIGDNLAPYNPTSPEVIDIAFSLLHLNPQDRFYDLGCGDARLLIAAKKLVESINAVGVEYDRDLFERAMRGVHEAFPLQAHAQNPSSSSARSKDDMGSVTGVAGAVTVIHADVQTVDFSDGTAFFIYLVPKGIASLRPALVKALERGARIVTYVFSIPDLLPTQVEVYKGITKIYLYTKASLCS